MTWRILYEAAVVKHPTLRLLQQCNHVAGVPTPCRGAAGQGGFRDWPTEVSEGMAVLDAVDEIQAKQADDLSCRWNCRAGKCTSLCGPQLAVGAGRRRSGAGIPEMHPLDSWDRLPELKQAHGVGRCDITRCCTKVCPENITITDNAIIPLGERVVDAFHDPLGWLFKRGR